MKALDNSSNEVWLCIKDFPNYMVSNWGRIKKIRNRYGNESDKIYNLKPSKDGYIRIGLYKNGKRYSKQVHRLVADAFLNNIYQKLQVNHIDGDKTNNAIWNLEFNTPSENQLHAYKTGLRKPLKGENSPWFNKHHSEESRNKISKANSKKVRCITTNEIFNSLKEASEKYNTSHISKCCKGKIKSAGKHPVTGEKLIWEYV